MKLRATAPVIAATVLTVIGTHAVAQDALAAGVFPLDGAAGHALRLCAAACETTARRDPVTVTVRGGRDAGYVSYFTPRTTDPDLGAAQVGASLNAFGFGVEGVLAREEDRDTLSLGAAFESDGWTIGGGLSFGVDQPIDSGADGAAQVGVDFTLSSGISVGGGLRLSDDPDLAEREVEAGFQMRLDF